MGNVKLVAKTNVKFGGKAERAPLGLGMIRTEEATLVAPGEEFEIDSDTAEELILAGSALSPADYKAEQSAKETAEDKVARMRDEIAEHEIEKKAQEGDSAAITSNAHLAAQEREEALVAEAQKKKGKRSEDGETKTETKTETTKKK
jgi:hypothetical protein